MKLTTFLILISMVSVFANKTYSQSKMLNLNMEKVTVREVLSKIEDQSEFHFMYSGKIVDVNRLVSINVQDAKIDEVLKSLFAGTDVDYTLKDRLIVLTMPESGDVSAVQQQKTISGKVTDSSGAGLPGVSVAVKGTARGSVTDSNGNYSLSNVPENATLQFSFVGMKLQEVLVGNKTTINVTMDEESIGIEEVVAVGYGTQKKVSLTGSIDVVSQEALIDRPVAKIGQLLQGLSPNLNISLSTFGGEPGADVNFNIRGTGTLSGSNAPLILVDGFEMNIANLDPDNIESVSVLKDAASSAIYGSRAPFGVVLITTKKGTKSKGVKVSYSNNTAFSSPLNLPKWESSLKYVTAYNQSLRNSGLPDKYLPGQIDRIERYLAGTYTPEYDTITPPNYSWGARHEGNANYDYYDVFFKDYTVNQKHNLDITGGDEKTQYYASGSFYDQGGSYNWVKEYYNRYNVLINVTSQATPWLRLNVSTKYANTTHDHPNFYGDNARSYLLSEMIAPYPIMSLYNVNGVINNPIIAWMQQGGNQKFRENDLFVILGTEIEPLKGWKTNANYSYNYTGVTRTYRDSKVLVEIPTGDVVNEGFDPDRVRKNWSAGFYKSFNAMTSYEKTYQGHFFKAMAGYEREYRYNETLAGSKYSLISPEVPSFSAATGNITLTDAVSHSATEAVFGRLNYNYKDKYLLEVNARYNGSSRFAEDSRWGFFPSVSAGYNIAKENFWAPLLHYVNNLKLRASYGSLGNQNVDNYLYLANVPISTNLEWILSGNRPIYSGIPGIISPSLTWETIGMLDLGADINFLNNRLGLEFDWYKRNTSNMFGPAQILPARLGTSAPQENNASMTTKGFELSLEWRDRINEDLNYSVRFTLADSKSKVTRYLNDAGLIGNWYEGKEVGEIWGYKTVGILQTQEEADNMPDQSYFYNTWGPGDIRYADLNGDEEINDGKRTLDDHGDLSVIGNTSPRYTFGITGSLSWKNFDFSMFWSGIGKRSYPNRAGWGTAVWWGVGGRGDAGGVLYEGMDNYWRPANETNILGPNTDAYFAKPYITTETLKNQQVQTRYMLNTSYVSLRNVQLGYTLPQDLTGKIKVESLKIYVSGENLLTFDHIPHYINAETVHSTANNRQTGAIYPTAKIVSLGLKVTF